MKKPVTMTQAKLFIFFSYTFVTVAYSARLKFSSSPIESPSSTQFPAARIANNASSRDHRCIRFDANDALRGSPDIASGFRLPSALKPVEYFLRIFPVPLGSQVFQAYTEVDLRVMNSTCEVFLNMANLTLQGETIKITRFGQSGREILAIRENILYPEREFGIFFLERPLQKGDTIRFSASYTGLLSNNSFGLNQIFYNDEAGTEKRVLATYFQPTGARRVYPCMDEPNLKAHFTVHIGVLAEETPLSNMRLLSKTSGENDTSWAIFEKTPPMSPYLLAFVISDFKKFPSNQTIANVWGRTSVVQQLRYSSQLAHEALNWLQDLLQVPFPLRKLDIVTLPSYTVPGMENWGLITSSEDALVTNGKPYRETWVATVTVHEVTHQWIGDLVTPVWWSQYWLSEGFTTFLTALALDQIKPELKATHNMLTQDAQFARKQDHGNRAIVLHINDFNPLEKQAKNVPMYFKGASVFRMMNFILGDEVFTDGLRSFFKEYEYKSFSDFDLYTVLENTLLTHTERSLSHSTLPAPFQLIMDSWAKQKGYPLLTVSRNVEGGITVKQQIFEEKNGTSPQPKNQTWWIPITIATSLAPYFNKTTAMAWLHPTNDPLALEGVMKGDSWVVLNVQQMAYLRVNYDDELWKGIATQLRRDHRVIHALNRLQLLEDSLYLFNTGFLDAWVPMSIMQYLSKEVEFHPLKTAFLYMTGIEVTLRRELEVYSLLKTFLLSILSPHLNGFFGQNPTEKLRRELILDWTCKLRHPACTKIAVRIFRDWKKRFDMELFPEKAAESMLCTVIESGSKEDWELVYNKLLTTRETKIRKQLINALFCTRNETLLKRYLDDIMSPGNNLTYEDAQNIYMGFSYSLRWNRKVWQYLNSNWDRLKERFGRAPIPLVTTAFDQEQLTKLFSSKYKDFQEFPKEVVQQYLDSNEEYVVKNERVISTLSEWLQKNVNPFLGF